MICRGGLKAARRVVAPYGVRAKTKEADEKWCRLDELRFCQHSVWQNVPKLCWCTARGEVRSKCKAVLKRNLFANFFIRQEKLIYFFISESCSFSPCTVDAIFLRLTDKSVICIIKQRKTDAFKKRLLKGG